MRKIFTTGDIHRITGCKINTLKDYIKFELIVPMQKEKNKKALFDKNAVLNAFLAFQLIRYRPLNEKNIRKNRQRIVNELKELEINWDEVGPDQKQNKYLVIFEKVVKTPLLKLGGWQLKKTQPGEQMQEKELMRVVFNLVAIKQKVEAWIKQIHFFLFQISSNLLGAL